MSESFELGDLDGVTVGTVGRPGDRTFFLQARRGAQIVAFKLEKQQVHALAVYLRRVLADLQPVGPDEVPVADGLVEPVMAEWVVGSMGLGYDENADRLVLVAEEAVFVPEPSGDDDPDELDELDELDEEVEPASIRVRFTRHQAVALANAAESLVAAGRPTCRLCGGPIDPTGHACPRLN